MGLFDFVSSKPLIEEAILLAHDPQALKEWAASNVSKFGIPFFLNVQAMSVEAERADQQNRNAWGNSVEDRMAFSYASIRAGSQPSAAARRRQAIEAVGRAALLACGPKIVGWAKSGLGKFISALGVQLPGAVATATPTITAESQAATAPPAVTSSPAATDPAGNYHVFLSHSRKDLGKSGAMKEIEYELKRFGRYLPWVDHHGIAVGEPLFETIERAIEGCFAFVLMWSENAALSESVRREIEFAERYGKPIIICLIEEPRAHFPVPGDRRAIQFFPAPARFITGLLELKNALQLLEVNAKAPGSGIAEKVQSVGKMAGELDSWAVRAASGERADPVSNVKIMLRTFADALQAGERPPGDQVLLRFCELMLKQLEMDPDIQTNEDLFVVAEYCVKRVDPNGENQQLAMVAAAIAHAPTGPE